MDSFSPGLLPLYTNELVNLTRELCVLGGRTLPCGPQLLQFVFLLQIINLHLTSAKQTKISHRRSTYGVCACMLLNTIFGRRPSLGVQKPGFRSLLISFVTWVESSRISGPRFLCKRRQYYVPCLLGNAAGRGLERLCGCCTDV